MKIYMSRAERGSEDGFTIREYGPGEVDVSEDLAREFIAMGATAAPDKHGNEVAEPKPVEMEGEAAVHHPRKTKRKGA